MTGAGWLIETRGRGLFGWIFLLLFWGFNALMAFALVAGVSEHLRKTPVFTDADMKEAYDVGTGIGIMIWLAFWAIGSVVLGLLARLTRGKRELTETETKSR
jgi:hypothetical protein